MNFDSSRDQCDEISSLDPKMMFLIFLKKKSIFLSHIRWIYDQTVLEYALHIQVVIPRSYLTDTYNCSIDMKQYGMHSSLVFFLFLFLSLSWLTILIPYRLVSLYVCVW